jgi:hypothetical protein
MSGIQVKHGKAFEYACLESLRSFLSQNQDVSVEESPQLKTARKSFGSVPDDLCDTLTLAADAATRVVVRLEPQLENPGDNKPLYLSIQADSQGETGDVRDILCIRKQNEWEIGLSCKHNHHAVKHSRLSPTINFGKEWFGIPCTYWYFDAITPLFDELRSMRIVSEATDLWSSIERKDEKYYVPVLRAFIDELLRLDKANPTVIPAKLIRYLIGNRDFYKVIADDRQRITSVQAVNLYGTLNRPSCNVKSIINAPKLKLPTQFHSVDFKKNSTTTINVVCDEGWQVSMRIHNASSRIEPSLKFDVNLVAMPDLGYIPEPW